MFNEIVTQAGPDDAEPGERAVKVDGVWMDEATALAGGWCGCVADECASCACDCECHEDDEDDEDEEDSR